MWRVCILLVIGLIQGVSSDRKKSFWLQFWIGVEHPGTAFGEAIHDLGAIWDQLWGLGEHDWRKQVSIFWVLLQNATEHGGPVHGHRFCKGSH